MRDIDATALSEIRHYLEHIEGTTRIAIGCCGQERQRVVFDTEPHRPATTLDIGERTTQQGLKTFYLERLQDVHTRAREQGAHRFETHIFRGRTDEDQRSIFEIRQKSVLLRLA